MTTNYTKCECGRRMRTTHIANHKRTKCPLSTNLPGHCAYCRQPHADAVLEKLRAGMVPEQVAHALKQEADYVLQVRARARKNGCLPPGPLHGSPQWHEERAARARYVMEPRECLHCGSTFTPHLGSTGQQTCSEECGRARKNHRRSTRSPSAVAEPADLQEPVNDSRQREEMRPLEERLAAVATLAEAAVSRFPLGSEASTRNWCELLGVAA